MFSSLSCRADTPVLVGERNRKLNYSVLADTVRFEPALLLSIEDTWELVPDYLRRVYKQTRFSTRSLESGMEIIIAETFRDEPGFRESICRRFYRTDETVLAIKSLVYLALSDALGIPSNWTLGPVWIRQPEDISADQLYADTITPGADDCMFISLIAVRDDTDSSNEFKLFHDYSLLNSITMDEIDQLDTALAELFEIYSLGASLHIDFVYTIDSTRSFNLIVDPLDQFARGVSGTVWGSGSHVYKGSVINQFASTLNELISLLVLNVKDSSHAPIFVSLGIRADLWTVKSTKPHFFSLLCETRIASPTLSKLLGEQQRHLTDKQKHQLVRAIASALVDINNKGIVHADLHAGNMLIDETRNYHTTIIDYGYAGPLFRNVYEGIELAASMLRCFDETACKIEFVKFANRFTHYAPEMLSNALPNTALSDKTHVWALAVAICLIAFPPGRRSTFVLIDSNLAIRPQYADPIGSMRFANEQVRALIDSAIAFHVQDRPSLAEFVSKVVDAKKLFKVERVS